MRVALFFVLGPLLARCSWGCARLWCVAGSPLRLPLCLSACLSLWSCCTLAGATGIYGSIYDGACYRVSPQGSGLEMGHVSSGTCALPALPALILLPPPPPPPLVVFVYSPESPGGKWQGECVCVCVCVCGGFTSRAPTMQPDGTANGWVGRLPLHDAPEWQLSQKRRENLETGQELQRFLQNSDELEEWMLERLTIAQDVSWQDDASSTFQVQTVYAGALMPLLSPWRPSCVRRGARASIRQRLAHAACVPCVCPCPSRHSHTRHSHAR